MPGGTKVLVAMSGGVDSSVAAAMLRREGYDVVGCFMRLGSPGETLDEPVPASCDPGAARIRHRGCCSVGDAADARLVAAELGIPLYVCNFKADFGRVIDYFVDEYAAGRTPNPCIRCNDWLKFGKLREYARQLGAEFVASGHYARVDAGPPAKLLRAVDDTKDQSYVLFGVPRQDLGHMLLPIGGMPKTEVRESARTWGLPVFDKPDSQEICFVPDDDYAGLVERRRPQVALQGAVLDESGRTIGVHGGQHRFTIGQRRGVGVATDRRLYVIAKDASANTVTLGRREKLATRACTATEANWLSDPGAFRDWAPCLARFRSNGPLAPARARLAADVSGPTRSGRLGSFEVEFEQVQDAVAPGQGLVLYGGADSSQVLCGGWVSHTET